MRSALKLLSTYCVPNFARHQDCREVKCVTSGLIHYFYIGKSFIYYQKLYHKVYNSSTFLKRWFSYLHNGSYLYIRIHKYMYLAKSGSSSQLATILHGHVSKETRCGQSSCPTVWYVGGTAVLK